MEEYDLILRQARLMRESEEQDLGIRDGKIVTISPSLEAPSARTISCEGNLLLPPFVDSHFHLDTVLSLEEIGENKSGTLFEGIQLWKEHKRTLTAERIYERADAYCRMAVAKGLLFIRSHVDVSHPDLPGVEALVALKKAWKGIVDIELVAFPQDGYLRNPQAPQLLKKALDQGVDVVGGIPHFERTQNDGEESVRQLCQLAADRGIPIDLHCDETDDSSSRHVAVLAKHVVEMGLQGRATASHTTSLHSVDDAFFEKLAPLLTEAEISVVANPLINITLQGRLDHYPKRRGITRIPELLQAGVNVAAGLDCVLDPWYALGTGDLLEAAHMVYHASQMTGAEDLRTLLDLV
ncbi:MAG: cytosine deaminase, partial [Verrucomicrobiota bacterium]